LNILAKGGTDIGRKRALNEDCYGIFDELGLFVVADGMGGHAAGEVASRYAVDVLRDFIAATREPGEATWPFQLDSELPRAANRLVSGIKLANQAINKASQESLEKKGMGTTIVAAIVEGDELFLAHVGDSRAYLFSDGMIRRITSDHSYVEEMVLAGHITQEQARVHPMRNIITRALGTKADVAVDLSRHHPASGDIYLLCSDGLSGMLTDGEIARIINSNTTDLSACIDGLIKGANEKGGDDNITAILLKAF
jgi:PPM family protein phosphatase